MGPLIGLTVETVRSVGPRLWAITPMPSLRLGRPGAAALHRPERGRRDYKLFSTNPGGLPRGEVFPHFGAGARRQRSGPGPSGADTELLT